MQDNSKAIIDKLNMRPIVGSSTLAEDSEAGIHCVGKAEHVQRLVDQMRSEVKPQSRSGPRIFAPALTHEWPVTIQVGLVMGYLAQHARPQNCLCSLDLAFPSPIVKDRQEPIVLSCDLHERASLGKRHGERFVDDDVLAGTKSGCRKREMTVVGGSNNHEIDVRMRRHFFRPTDNDLR